MSEVGTVPSRGELFVHPDPVQVLLTREKFDAFFAEIAKESRAHVPEVRTSKGRDEIKRLSFKLTKTRTFLDSIGKKLNEDARKQINTVDEARRHMREKLEDLQDEVRQPLTAWEKAESDRVSRIAFTMEYLRQAVNISGSAQLLWEELAKVRTVEIEPIGFGDETPFAEKAREDAIAALTAKIEQAKKAEADREELSRLRAAEAQRLEDERKAREAAERQESEENARRAAAEAARQEAERRAAADLAAQEAAHQAELRRLAQVEEERKAAEASAAEDKRRREADAEHRAQVMREALVAIKQASGIGETIAKKLVSAIARGEIPHVTMNF